MCWLHFYLAGHSSICMALRYLRDSYRSVGFGTWHIRALDPYGGSFPRRCKNSYAKASGSSRRAQKRLQMAADQWYRCAWALCWCQSGARPIRLPAHLQIWNNHFRCSDTVFRPATTSSYFSSASCGRTRTLLDRPFRNPASYYQENVSRGKKGSAFPSTCCSKTWSLRPFRN